MKIGDKIPARELTDLLDSTGVRSKYADQGLEELKSNLDIHGWKLHHVAYKPQLKLTFKDEPGFRFLLQDPSAPDVVEPINVPYGPQVRDFVLERCQEIFYIRDVEFYSQRGIPEERLAVP